MFLIEKEEQYLHLTDVETKVAGTHTFYNNRNPGVVFFLLLLFL